MKILLNEIDAVISASSQREQYKFNPTIRMPAITLMTRCEKVAYFSFQDDVVPQRQPKIMLIHILRFFTAIIVLFNVYFPFRRTGFY
jgi:hypothetical protein